MQNRMKIAHVCNFYEPAIGGVKQVVYELSKRQVKEGHEVHIFTSDWDKTKRIKVLEEEVEGVKIHRFKHWFRAGNFGVVWPTFFNKIINEEFDIIHTHLFGHFHFFLGSIASRISGAKHIHTTHCPWSDAYRSIPGRFFKFLSYNIFSKIALKMTDRIIAITPWEISFIKRFSYPEEKIEVIPNGMGKEFIERIKNNNFKKRNNISNEIILFLGRLSETKRPDNFVKIAEKILEKRKDLTFVIRGPDEGLLHKVEEMVRGNKNIKLLPPATTKKEVIETYQSAKIYVLPSYREGLPLTMFEAMACGLPVVASNVNGVPYELKEGVNGYILDRSNIKGFAEKINYLLENKEVYSKISQNNINKAKKYDWDKINKTTMSLYSQALKS